MVVGLPDLAKTLLSSEMLHFSVEGHYTLGLIAVLFVGYIYSLKHLSEKCGSWVIERLPIVTLVITIGLSVAHSPMPISFNFWSNWSGGAFNYSNYLPSERTLSLRKVEQLIGQNTSLKLEVTNGAFTPKLGMRRPFVHLFPGPSWEGADFIVLDKKKFEGAGSHAAQSSYADLLAKALSQLPQSGFKLLLDDAYVQLWARESTGR